MTDKTEGRVIAASLLLGCRHLLPPLAEALGHDADALLPGTRWPLEDFLLLLQRADEGPLPHIGLHQGTRLDLGALGPYGQAVQSAATLGEALICAQRYLPWLVSPARLDLHLTEHHLRLDFRLRSGGTDTRQFDELLLALLDNALTALTLPATRAERVELAHPTPHNAQAYRTAFDGPITFGSQHNRLFYPRAALERPLRTAEPGLHRYLLNYLAHPPLATMPDPQIPPASDERWEWIKYQLRARGHSLAEVARHLGVSSAAVKNAKRQSYPRVERAIAEFLGLSPALLWPERSPSTSGTTSAPAASNSPLTVASAEEG